MGGMALTPAIFDSRDLERSNIPLAPQTLATA